MALSIFDYLLIIDYRLLIIDYRLLIIDYRLLLFLTRRLYIWQYYNARIKVLHCRIIYK